MTHLADFFVRNISEVYFLYGLAFFVMGLAILLEIGHSSELDFAKALIPLAVFGLLHGSHEWFEMFLLNNPELAKNPAYAWIGPFRLIMLALSFLMLVAFGARLISGPGRTKLFWSMMAIVSAVWLVGLLGVLYNMPPGKDQLVSADVYTRYSLAIPGAVLTAWGLVLQRSKFNQVGMRRFGRDAALAAMAFLLYGAIGQLFASPSAIFPSSFFNSDLFVRTFGFPIQVFRAVMACFAAVFIIRSLRAFQEENKRQMDALREAQMAERRRLEAIRSELLHRTVKAQEAERQRIARELHDETGQTLTALGLGLRGLTESIASNPPRAIQQARQLERLAVGGIEELQRMVSGLHPPQLDDLGLMAALRWYSGEVKQRYGLEVTLNSQGNGPELPVDVRIVFFRIAQEAITNAVRHAEASQVVILLENTNQTVRLSITDNGQGFNVSSTLSKETDRPNWGLLGMLERASLIGGVCQITSFPGVGTCVEVKIDREAHHA